MSKFSHLKPLQVTVDDVVPYTFKGILVNGVNPVLYVKPAAECNKPYFNEVLKTQGRKVSDVVEGNIDVGILAENRNQDRELFPKYIVDRWDMKTIIDSDGNQVEFSYENCKDFLDSVPNDEFDKFRHFCATLKNFKKETSINVGEKAKN